MALLVLLMPTNYRAGTQTSHPHAFFQEMIDLVVGHTHEHGESIDPAPDHGHDTGSNHTHSQAEGEDHPAQTKAVSSSAPDLPGVSELTPSAEKANAILVLTMILSAIAQAGWRRRDLWSRERVLRAVVHPVEAPPPRAPTT